MVKDNYAMDTKDEDIVGQPNPVDIYVGSRLKLRRLILGISQKKMAEKLGITFQQVQKYENGINRISASRLWDISKLLKVQVEYFFDGMNESIQAQSPRSLRKIQFAAGRKSGNLSMIRCCGRNLSGLLRPIPVSIMRNCAVNC